MIKHTLIIIFSILCQNILLAQNPIPSFGFHVCDNANFQELRCSNLLETIEKRDIVVKTTCGGGNICNGIVDDQVCTAQIWIYSLDGQTIWGPFIMFDGDIVTQEIDEREWGVYVESSDAGVYIDVWIE